MQSDLTCGQLSVSREQLSSCITYGTHPRAHSTASGPENILPGKLLCAFKYNLKMVMTLISKAIHIFLLLFWHGDRGRVTHFFSWCQSENEFLQKLREMTGSDKIQTHKRFKRMLFFWTKHKSILCPNKEHSFEPCMCYCFVLEF